MPSSVESVFQLAGYKIDDIKFTLNHTVGNLLEGLEQSNETVFQIGFHEITKIPEERNCIYICGISSKFELKTKNNESLAKGEVSLSGYFKTDNTFTENQEKHLVKLQAPTILFPYLRSSITNILASAGFGSIILPLLNISAMAKKTEIRMNVRDRITGEMHQEVLPADIKE
jgi:preprotein translocase subunit SecB